MEQHSLGRSIALHLFPGAMLGAFILAVVPLLERWHVDPLFALFGGVLLVLVPVELGYLVRYAHRTTGQSPRSFGGDAA